MKRRLYFLLPDVASARAMLDELLLARIEERCLHFHAKEGTLPRDMPEANFFQKTDLIHGAEVGMVIGAFSGLLAGSLILIFPPEGIELRTVALLVATIGGAIFGSWASGMAAAAIPNSRLKQFSDDIERGQVLLMVDVPYHRIAQVEDMIAKRHPEVRFGGVEPHIPAFP
ncbi:DUF1269 domain-containing protein [Undibacterium sp. Jales W-56]|uniref:DUF1269 domain-containing protein n=1 Tax=Undibacterium sp. Jales W-56 TaxID=2897325 RepID=UPI0021D07740|nr:DUF1269 domain-containing protein [Undibacterium sp. Jales W-56]MCU6434851.1 DUF1269 domain-containing protein [Undibacterium sp. Jales W-56]